MLELRIQEQPKRDLKDLGQVYDKPNLSKINQFQFSFILIPGLSAHRVTFIRMQGADYSSVPYIRNNVFNLRSYLFLIKWDIKFKSGYSFLLEKSCTIIELLRHKPHCHINYTILICISKFSLPRKSKIIQGKCFLLHLHVQLLFSFEYVQSDSTAKLNLLCFSNF